MGIGSILVGIALLLVVVAYLARRFRVAGAGPGLNRAIEAWVAQVRAQGEGGRRGRGAEEQGGGEAGERAAYCPQCGRRVGPDDRFCAGCGTPLNKRGWE